MKIQQLLDALEFLRKRGINGEVRAELGKIIIVTASVSDHYTAKKLNLMGFTGSTNKFEAYT